MRTVEGGDRHAGQPGLLASLQRCFSTNYSSILHKHGGQPGAKHTHKSKVKLAAATSNAAARVRIEFEIQVVRDALAVTFSATHKLTLAEKAKLRFRYY